MIKKIIKVCFSISCFTLFPYHKQASNIVLTSASTSQDLVDVNWCSYFYNQYSVNQLNLKNMRLIDNPKQKVYVGVVDGGIDYSSGNLNIHTDQALNSLFYDEVPIQTREYSDLPHGTHVAGIINLTSNQNACLIDLPYKKIQSTYDSGKIARCINFAKNNNIKILNFSFGYETSTIEYEAVKNAISNYDGLIVCSAGNKNYNFDKGGVYYPASYEFDNIICVGASTSNDTLWYENGNSATNYGTTSVDLFAPGENIMSFAPIEDNNEGYSFKTGTSMAAPMVTGVAALLMANYPELSTKEIKDIILNNVDKVDSYYNKCSTGGRLNAYKALKCLKKDDHVHDFNLTYNDLEHTYACECGVKNTFEHEMKITYYDKKTHISECSECGYNTKSVHVIKESSILGNIAVCAECDAKLDLRSDIGITPIFDSIIYITENGSYKLPNGIIVLTDIDYIAYKNGTLIFNNKDNSLS